MKKPKRGRAPRPDGPKRATGGEQRQGVGQGGGWLSADGYRFSDTLVMLSPVRGLAETIGGLADELIDRHLARGRRGLAVCAASPGVGATFLSTNLAIALSQAGVTTLLVDANLRAPGLHELIRPPGDVVGLRQMLQGDPLGPGDLAHADVLPRLSLIYAGPATGEEPELLAGDRFQRFATACLRDYECTIFDAPPANRSADARVVGATAGYAVLVARRAKSYVDDLALLTAQLEQDGVVVVGSVLNA